MTLCQAYNIINNKGITPWMAYAISKWNNEYCIYETLEIKKHLDLNIIYIRKGECFPGNPILKFNTINYDKL